MKAAFLAAIAAFLATGCANTTQEVRVPVMVQCVKELPKAPQTFSDSDLKALPDGDLVLGLASDRLRWRAYSSELLALLQACR